MLKLNKIIFLFFLFFSCENNEKKSVPYPRVISLLPNITEIIFALQKSHHLVGVTRYCTHPEEAKKIKKVGGILDYNREVILSLKPHFVFAGEGIISSSFQKIAMQAGIKFEFFKLQNFYDLEDSIRKIAKILKAEKEGEKLIEKIKTELENIKERVSKIKSRPKVLFIVGHNPLYVVGGESFVGNLVQLAGGKNCNEKNKGYLQYSMENVIRCNPDIIIDKGIENSFPFSFWMKYEEILAVKNKRVYKFANDGIFKPGPRTLSALRELSEIIHR